MAGGSFDSGPWCLEAAVGDVFGHRGVEEEHLLTHQANRPPQILEAQRGDRLTIEKDSSLLHFIEAQQQLHDRALP